MLLIGRVPADCIQSAGFRLHPTFQKDGPGGCSARESGCSSFTSPLASCCHSKTLPACFLSEKYGLPSFRAIEAPCSLLEGWCRKPSFLPVPLNILVCVWTHWINHWSTLQDRLSYWKASKASSQTPQYEVIYAYMWCTYIKSNLEISPWLICVHTPS